MQDRISPSPYAEFLAYCAHGELRYQTDAEGTAVSFPRLFAPGTGGPLTWDRSKGSGTVYATTIVHRRDEPPLNVALIDLDEGFRIMSRVEDIEATQVRIGMRVRVQMRPIDGVPLPVFIPETPSDV